MAGPRAPLYPHAEMPRTRATLSVKERLFVQHYLGGKPGIRGNGTRAYIAAGYAPKAASSGAWELLRKPQIEAAVEVFFAKRDITVGRVLEELRRIALSDMRDFVDWRPDGVRLKPSTGLSSEAAACVAEVTEHVTETGRHVRFKLHDKMAALTTLAKHLGLLREPEAPGPVAIFPKGFFAAFITGDPTKLEPGA
jgi:phage terminase small subunit